MSTRNLLSSLGAVLVATVAAGCPTPDEGDPCPACAEPQSRGAVESTELEELSGLAASGLHPDVLYAHNDAGDAARIFALSSTGAPLSTYTLTGADNVDWEDVAQAPCAAGRCLYVGDIGDNEAERLTYSIYVVTEPTTIEPGEHALAADRVRFRYPDGSHDAESLLVHPSTGAVTIVTKAEKGPASIYELPPLTPDETLTAVLVGELDPPEGNARLTGGTVHPGGTSVQLRTKALLYSWALAPAQTVADALAGTPCTLPLADENQGEAVTWLGEAIVTIGEGEHASINVSECTGT